MLGIISTKVGARTTILRELTKQEEIKFFEDNHLQGYTISSYCVALVLGDEILCAMSVGTPRYDKKADLELIRVATKKNHLVQGGASKLFSHLKGRYKGLSIISYRDRRWGSSNFYEKLGFKLHHVSAPSYIYVKKGLVISRYAAMKNKLPKLLGESFDPILTESENMKKAKFFKIWDCGQEVYTMNL